jgi:hypothetical protein
LRDELLMLEAPVERLGYGRPARFLTEIEWGASSEQPDEFGVTLSE